MGRYYRYAAVIYLSNEEKENTIEKEKKKKVPRQGCPGGGGLYFFFFFFFFSFSEGMRIRKIVTIGVRFCHVLPLADMMTMIVTFILFLFLLVHPRP